jgi:hypothetical protein
MPATRPVFSALFFSAYPCPAGATTAGGPDNVHVWVVRDIVVTNTNPWFETASTFYITDSGGAWIFGVQPPDGFNGRIYHWQGRQVLTFPETLRVFAGDSAWSVRISGYNLTLT